MKKTKVNKKRINYNKIKRYAKGFCLLCTTLICILYMLYIIIISMLYYLHNRPIRTVVLFSSISILCMICDTIQGNKRVTKERKAKQSK